MTMIKSVRYFTVVAVLLLATLASIRAPAASQGQDLLFHNPATPRLGAADAKLTLVVFTDYNCPYCKRLDPLLEQIVSRYPQVAVAIKILPFKGESAHRAAQLALTLWRQQPERFLALHRTLMSKRGYHSAGSLQEALQRSGNGSLQPDGPGSIQELRDTLMLAQALGVEGTPTMIIGNQLIPGALEYEQLEQAVQAALAQQP
ncbi:Secreted protein, suppressor for copper-sensitivity ScsC [Edwardsiella anguillarum]|uniref:DsbA family protein n=1 Tax=Edwardsiella TaxID=635 RepID=UPI00045CCDC6|nr:DsbA family protein [Edwardsiella anguillarum]GAJ65975.1 outer membrane protein [Edwardsiella piscicida]WHP79292.1 thioredoxin domain-containing protein [Edwardsiella anguillarum]WHQ15089.1 thioredoxin domain-containing protein [Edwardsiella anguillarum]WHQ16750.1 thioredoxin domain-containing protein [Edwardsiella anguillarum]WHQ20285.1 thioredoxin domain-containing protein [Edwardsiella anguillarum]